MINLNRKKLVFFLFSAALLFIIVGNHLSIGNNLSLKSHPISTSDLAISLSDRNEMPLPIKITTFDMGIAQGVEDEGDAILTSRVIQGLVNRQSTKKIWLFNDSSHSSYTGSNKWNFQEVMLETLPEVKDLPRNNVPRQAGVNGGLHALLKYTTIHYPELIKGWVLWDTNLEGQVRQSTSGAAITIAAQKNYLPVSPELKDLIESWGFDFPELIDLRDLNFSYDWQVLDWLVENYFATSNRKHQLLYSTGINSNDNPAPYESDTNFFEGVIDYAVATNGFAFNIDMANSQDDRALINMLRQPGLIEGRAGVLGWIPTHPGRRTTSEVPKIVKSTSYYVIGTSISSNFSVLGAFPDSQVDLPEPKAYPIDKKDVFITWWIADGGNLDHTFKGMFGLFKKSPEFGQRGITWSINPILADLTPPLYNWYADVLPTENDMGIIFADKWMCTNQSNFEQAAYVWRTFAQKADLPVVNNFCAAEGQRADIVNWLGVIQGLYNLKPPVQRLDKTNSDTSVLGMYMFQDPKYARLENVQEIANGIREWVKTQAEPQFMPVSIGKATYWQHHDYFKIAKALEENLLANPEGRRYHFVRARDLMMTHTSWQGRKWDWNREIEQDFVDNSEIGFSQSDGWVKAPRSFEQYDKDYLLANAQSNAWAQWKPDIKEKGKYKVYLWWQPGKDRATKAKLIVNHARGKEIKELNQKKGVVRGWNEIGTYQLDQNSFIRISADNTTNGKIVADAARFVRID